MVMKKVKMKKGGKVEAIQTIKSSRYEVLSKATEQFKP